MPEIQPFEGLRYNPEKVDPNCVVCPPYDIISPEEQRLLLDRDPCNAVRLTLGEGTDWHGKAAEQMKNWTGQGILQKEDSPSIYLYQHRFAVKGQPRVRRGFVALLRLAERNEQQVLPHERTFEGPKADRLKLMKACQANMSSIFLLCLDPDGRIRQILDEESRAEGISVTDEKQVEHFLRPFSDPDKIRVIQQVLQDQKVFVADGHHRYETAQNYRDWRRSQSPSDGPDAPYNFQMVYLCPIEDPGMLILPTHRIVGGVSWEKIKSLKNELKSYFEIEDAVFTTPLEFSESLAARGKDGRQVIGVYLREGQCFFCTPRPDVIEKYVGDSTRTMTWRSLDVSILHEVILHRVLGIEREKLLDHVKYVREVEEGVRLVEENKKQVAFFLNGTPPEKVRQICLEGEHMPQKSTDFYPKLLTGLVFYQF